MSDMDTEKLAIGGVIVALIGLIALIVVSGVEEQRQWDSFAVEHKCKMIEYRKGDVLTTTATTISPNGGVSVTPMTTVTPDKRAFACNDGVTYWR